MTSSAKGDLNEHSFDHNIQEGGQLGADQQVNGVRLNFEPGQVA